MTDKDPLVEEDKKRLEHLEEDLGQARQHLKEQSHEGEETFIEECDPRDHEETDDTVAPPG